MNFREMKQAVDDAEVTLRLANQAVQRVAHVAAGRLRSAGVPSWVLEGLKKELKNYNIHTGRWKDD